MPENISEAEFLRRHQSERYKKPKLMVDISIFTIFDDALRVLLVKRGQHPFKGMWSLPGGAVHVDRDSPGGFDETLEDAAKRELIEETGVKARYLGQVKTYGNASRDPRDWTVSVAYFALMDSGNIALQHGSKLIDAGWHTVRKNGVGVSLAFDHSDILGDAVQRLRSKVEYTAIAACLLPKAFTLPRLKHVYELLLQEAIPNKSFRRRIENTDLIVPIEGRFEKSKKGPKAQLFRYKPKKKQTLFFPRSIVWAEKHNESG